MGQAFDDEGRLLGEAFGDTMADVLQQLEGRFGAQAARVEIGRINPKKDGSPKHPLYLSYETPLQAFRSAHR